MTQPNPAIYREAAQLLSDRGGGYSCNAILDVCARREMSCFTTRLYQVQYLAALGLRPEAGMEITASVSFFWANKGCIPLNHPFWNRNPANPEMLRRRILALLFMAELCENP